MADNSNRQKVTVEALLRLKKNERPPVEFWDSFERDFDRRRLHELVNRPSWRDIILRPAFKVLSLGIPAVAMIAFAMFWTPAEKQHVGALVIRQEPAKMDDPEKQMDLPASKVTRHEPREVELAALGASNQFVVDAFHEQSPSASNFRKVLYTPAIRLSVPTGASYVRDSLSSSSYDITTADVKLGRNF